MANKKDGKEQQNQSHSFRLDKENKLFYAGKIAYRIEHFLHSDNLGHKIRQISIMPNAKSRVSVIWGSATYSSNYSTYGPEDRVFQEEPFTVEVALFFEEKFVDDPFPHVTVGEFNYLMSLFRRTKLL